jgi:periplasmic divalent cation tolerance protein
MDANDGNGAGAVVLVTTIGDPDEASALARALVERRMAACVSILPGVRSTYRWKDGIQEDSELLLWIKTRPALVDPIKTAWSALHPYEIPELLVLPVIDGLPAYLAWLQESTAHPDTEVM